MIAVGTPRLKDIFSSDDFAWDILEQEIVLETSGKLINGEDIAKLLALYMKGVETLNSVRDNRELFFRNRLNNLMMRPTVVKALNSSVQGKTADKVQDKPQLQAESPEHKFRKGEIEMRLTYAQEEHSQQKLKKILVEHQSKTSTLTNTIQTIIDEGRNKLDQRIRLRKLRCATARERSVQAETCEEKQQRPDRNEPTGLEILDEIQEEQEEKVPYKKPTKRRLSLGENPSRNYQSCIEVAAPMRRVSLLIPSRKQSD